MLLPSAGRSQTNSYVELPKIGHFYDADSRQVLPAMGIPGSALLGPAIEFPLAIEDAAIPPSSDWLASPDWLVVLAGAERKLYVAHLKGQAASLQAVEEVAAGVDRVILSPRGRTALLYRQGARKSIEVVTGLPEAPAMQRKVDVSMWDVNPAYFAVSDDGAAAIAALRTGGVLWLEGSFIRLVATEVPAGPSAFAPDGATAVITAGSRALLMRGAEMLPLAQGPEPVAGVALDGAATRVFLAYRTGLIESIETASGISRQAECHCKPESIQPMMGDSLFRLNQILLSQSGSGPRLLLDGSGAEPRILFVPLDREGSQ
jgi:hypothetical protein